MTRRREVGCALFLTLVMCLAPRGEAQGARATETVRTEVPHQIDGLRDVRWDGPDRLLVTANGFGVAALSYQDGVLGEPVQIVPESSDGTVGIVIAVHLGASPTHLAVGSPVSELLWVDRAPAQLGGRA